MKIKLYFLTLVIFLAIDSLWLGLVAPKFYQAQIGHLMAETAHLLAASIFYLLFVGALVYFVVAPGIRGRATREVLLHGALFGLVTYATYDLTNLATLRDWPVLVTVVDMVWGTVDSSHVRIQRVGGEENSCLIAKTIYCFLILASGASSWMLVGWIRTVICTQTTFWRTG